MGLKSTHAQVQRGEGGDQGDNISNLQDYFCLLASPLADTHDGRTGRENILRTFQPLRRRQKHFPEGEMERPREGNLWEEFESQGLNGTDLRSIKIKLSLRSSPTQTIL